MDFNRAKKIFAEYLKQYDAEDDKIRLKIVHTYGVVHAAEYIAEGLSLSKENTDLARLIALLHDIGRFEQLRIHHSFDDSIVPHAKLSLEILFDRGMIKEFLPEQRQYDDIIYTAIENHGLYRMNPALSGDMLLHSALIRDADKLDNFRVKEDDSIETMLDVTAEELGRESISPHIYQAFISHTPIRNSDRVTHMDMWLSYLGYIYDLNYPASRRYVLEHNTVNHLIDRIPYTNQDTANLMEQVRHTALDYLSEEA